MKKIAYFLVCLLKIHGADYFAPSMEVIFQEFMSDLFQNTTAGYVVFGHKPLNICNFNSLRSHIPGSDLHRASVLGLLCQEFLRDMSRRDNWIFAINQPTHPDNYELLIGNRAALIAAINAHLELFQLKFGFNTKPNEILKQLEQVGFGALFRGEVALQGIVLGYDYENAISCERLVKSNYKKTKEFDDFTYYTPLSPSDLTMIPFTYHSNLPSNRSLISLYKKDQKTIETVLKKPDWSKRVLSTCFKNKKKFHPISSDEFSIPKAIAFSIQESCSIYFSPQFIEGMKAAEAGKSLTQPAEFIYFDYFYRDDFSIQNGRENRIFSDRFFETDTIGKTIIIPKRLAIRVLREAKDITQTVMHPQDGLFLYVIKTLEGVPIRGSFYLQEPSPIPEKDLCPGLSLGVIAMHPGEEREIFIHPDFFYNTSEGGGKPVIVRIVCQSILPSLSFFPPLSLLPIQMKHSPLSITTAEQFSKIQSKIQEWAGWQAWMHYKGSCSLQEVLNLLHTDIPPPASKGKLDMLLFEWNRYKKLKVQQL